MFCYTGRSRISIIVALCVISSSLIAQTVGVAYSRLSPAQQSAFRQFSGCTSSCQKAWEKLTSSEELEFAGGTQALHTIHITAEIKGSDEIGKVTRINGSLPGQQSQNQFNVETLWKQSAAADFASIPGWSDHIALLHGGQYGYQEDREGNPFLGLVVLFSDKPGDTSGQFHIDFRSWFSHYCADNGNLAANYKTYVKWYGRIDGYTPVFQFVFPELATPATPTVSRIPPGTSMHSHCSADILNTVPNFLKSWYVDRNFEAAMDFVAKDNVYNAANLEALGLKASSSLWMRLFSDAFLSSVGRIESLEAGLEFHPPTFSPRRALLYNNRRAVESGVAPYAIVNPSSLPEGSVFPPRSATLQRRTEWDIQARFLDHLRTAYGDRLYVVIYATRHPLLIRETVFQYWIREDNCWRIAAFQGTDW